MWNMANILIYLGILISVVFLPEMVETVKSKTSKEVISKGPPVNDVKLYSERNYEGKILRLRLEEDACANLPSTWEKQVSSVDPSACVILYADQNCRGFRKRLDKWSYGSSNLKDIAFESKLSSVSTCPTVKKPVIPDEL